jgi:hypothetical protein
VDDKNAQQDEVWIEWIGRHSLIWVVLSSRTHQGTSAVQANFEWHQAGR